jgi:CheY-like chemotaxis protein
MNPDFDSRTILLTEDNEDDAFIFERAFKQAGGKNPLQVAADGQEVHDYLSGAGKFADRKRFPMPVLLLLDLKLPLRSGLEVLEWIRGEPGLMSLPVVVLTSSAEHRDLAASRDLGARFYLLKPPTPRTLSELISLYRAEWNGDSATDAVKLEADLFTNTAEAARRASFS